MRVRLVEGGGLLDDLGERLDALHAATQTPVTARRPWLQTWLACYPDVRPFGLVVEDDSGQLAAAALLAEQRRRGIRSIVALGAGPSDQVRFPARNPEAAKALADGLADTLVEARLAWRLAIQQLSDDDGVVATLRSALPYAWVAPGDVSPLLAVGETANVRAYVSRNHHQQVRRMRNRIRRDGFASDTEHLTDPAAIAAVLPEVMEVCRARDMALGRPSQVDDSAAGPFLREVIGVHARRGETVLTTLRLDGRLAAYVLCFVDEDTWRMWNCRFHPDWEKYGVGRIANESALEYALTAGCRVFDWMRGEERYKRSMSNGEVRAIDLYAASNAALAAFATTRPRLRLAAHRIESSGPAGARAIGVARRMSSRQQV